MTKHIKSQYLGSGINADCYGLQYGKINLPIAIKISHSKYHWQDDGYRRFVKYIKKNPHKFLPVIYAVDDKKGIVIIERFYKTLCDVFYDQKDFEKFKKRYFTKRVSRKQVKDLFEYLHGAGIGDISVAFIRYGKTLGMKKELIEFGRYLKVLQKDLLEIDDLHDENIMVTKNMDLKIIDPICIR